MTAQNASDSQIQTFEGTMLADGFQSILRACRRKPAGRGRAGGDYVAVKLYRHDQTDRKQLIQQTPQPFQHFHILSGYIRQCGAASSASWILQ